MRSADDLTEGRSDPAALARATERLTEALAIARTRGLDDLVGIIGPRLGIPASWEPQA